MNKFFIAASFVLALGCGKKDKLDQALSDLEGWKNKMCACKDKACTESTHEAYKKWEDEMEKSMKDVDKDKVDKSKIAQFEKLDDARKDCRRKFRDPEPAMGGEPPAAPAPTP